MNRYRASGINYEWVESSFGLLSFDIANIFSVLAEEVYIILKSVYDFEKEDGSAKFYIKNSTNLTGFLYDDMLWNSKLLVKGKIELTARGHWLFYRMKKKIISQDDLDYIILHIFERKFLLNHRTSLDKIKQ